LFSYLGLLPWAFFATSLSLGGQSLVTNATLINKVHCPREVFPLASILVAAADTIVAVLALGALFLLLGFAPTAKSIWVPVLLLPLIGFTVGVTLLTSAMVVYLRDLRHVLPIVLQVGLFATPVAYGINVIPANVRGVYSTLNPLAPVIDSLRRTVLQGLQPDWSLLVPAAITSIVVLVGGFFVFKRVEVGFADVA
jgi:ABC-2 type transport system permease protein/lipopolysaccharide transport system permease protein